MILDQYGKPAYGDNIEGRIRHLMDVSLAECQREVDKAMFQRQPRLLDQFGKDILPLKGADGLLAALRSSEQVSWGGAEIQLPTYLHGIPADPECHDGTTGPWQGISRQE